MVGRTGSPVEERIPFSECVSRQRFECDRPGCDMTLLERWRAVPADIRWGYAVFFLFSAQFVTEVLVGPSIFLVLIMSWCLVRVLMAFVAVMLACYLVAYPSRWARAVPLGLVCGCLLLDFVVPRVT